MKIKIAENIKSLRKAHSLTQEQMAEALGVTVGAVYKWEAGLSVPEIKLIIEIADFFEISVDTLLGYEQQNGNVENRIQRIKQCILEKDFEDGVTETEKSLKKYPNNFSVTYASAMLYMLKFAEDKSKDDMLKSNRLFKKSISLLYQNTEKSINETTILNHMASNYLSAGDIEKGLEILKQNNICNINSGQIGFIYATELNKPDKAEKYLLSSMSEIINKTIFTVGGMAYAHALQGNKACITEALWLIRFFDSLKENADDVTFLDKFKAMLLAQCAVWEASFKHMDKAREYITNAYLLAEQFDKSPIYSTQNVVLMKGTENKGDSFDGIGKTTKEAIEKFVFGKVYKSEAVAQIKELWEELKYGGKQTG
ncbi:MAG: helix-turn-helix transcriptional regulator [Acutalibacteraceae bacterium]|nr:helix-turn-helix transcriptional regulator [Acutalibacteraceae bacterium]